LKNSLDSRSFNFKLTEKKEIAQKVILKDCRDKHQLQLSGKIASSELLRLYTTFKPSDYPFKPAGIEDEPMSLKNKVFGEYPKKLPTYRIEIIDNENLYITLKVLISVLKFQSASDKSVDFIVDLLKHLFKIE